MNYSLLIILFSFLTSCSLFHKNTLSTRLSEDIQNVCLNAEGKGRLVIDGQKYIFSFESAMNQVENKWQMGFSFPIYGEEFLEIDWDENNKMKYVFSFEDKILKEQRGVSPEKLELFIKTWADLLQEIIHLQSKIATQTNYKWITSDKELSAQTKLKEDQSLVTITFKNLVDNNYFGRYDIVMQHNNEMHPFSVEFIVRKCLEVAD